MSSERIDTSSSSMSFHTCPPSGSCTVVGMDLAKPDTASSTVYSLIIKGKIWLLSSASYDILLRLIGRQKTCTCRSCELGFLTRPQASGLFQSVKSFTGVIHTLRSRRRSTSSKAWI